MQKQNFNPSMNAVHMEPMDKIAGFEVRPGLYELNGAVAIPVGVNFTIHSLGATSCELLLFRLMEDEPYAVLKFPEHYRIGNVYSMIVFGLHITEFEYAYRLDGPYDRPKVCCLIRRIFYWISMPKPLQGRAYGGRRTRAAAFIKRELFRITLTGGRS